MAEQIIKAGAKIDAVTHRELEDTLTRHFRSWMAETIIGGRFTRFAATGLIASSAVSVGGAGPTGQQLGPDPGFVWDVRRLHITGLADTDVASVYVNDSGNASIVATTTDLPLAKNRSFTWDRQVVLYPGDSLLVSGSTLTATGTVTVSGQVLELPIGLAWKLAN